MPDEVKPPLRDVDWSTIDSSPISAASFGIVQSIFPGEFVLTFGYESPRAKLSVEAMTAEEAHAFLEATPIQIVNPVRVSIPIPIAVSLARNILQSTQAKEHGASQDEANDE